MDRIQPTQKLRRWQDFLGSFDQTIVHTAGKENYIVDALSRNYQRPSTSTEEEDYIPQSIDKNILHRAPSLPTPPNTITATTSPYLLSPQKCQNTNPPQPATSRTQIVNIICAEALAKPPVITTVAPTKMIMIGNTSLAILRTPSSRKLHHQPTLRQNLRANNLHQSTQRSLRGTHLLQSSKSE